METGCLPFFFFFMGGIRISGCTGRWVRDQWHVHSILIKSIYLYNRQVSLPPSRMSISLPNASLTDKSRSVSRADSRESNAIRRELTNSRSSSSDPNAQDRAPYHPSFPSGTPSGRSSVLRCFSSVSIPLAPSAYTGDGGGF